MAFPAALNIDARLITDFLFGFATPLRPQRFYLMRDRELPFAGRHTRVLAENESHESSFAALWSHRPCGLRRACLRFEYPTGLQVLLESQETGPYEHQRGHF